MRNFFVFNMDEMKTSAPPLTSAAIGEKKVQYDDGKSFWSFPMSEAKKLRDGKLLYWHMSPTQNLFVCLPEGYMSPEEVTQVFQELFQASVE